MATKAQLEAKIAALEAAAPTSPTDGISAADAKKIAAAVKLGIPENVARAQIIGDAVTDEPTVDLAPFAGVTVTAMTGGRPMSGISTLRQISGTGKVSGYVVFAKVTGGGMKKVPACDVAALIRDALENGEAGAAAALLASIDAMSATSESVWTRDALKIG